MKRLILFLLLGGISVFLLTYFKFWLNFIAIVFSAVAALVFIAQIWKYNNLTKLENYSHENIKFGDFIVFSSPKLMQASFWEKAKLNVILFCTFCINAFCWPASLVYEAGLEKNANELYSGYIQGKKPFLFYMTIYLLLLAGLLYWASSTQSFESKYLLGCSIGLIAIILLQLIVSLASKNNLASIFKNSHANIRLNLVFVCLGLAGCLFLLFSIVYAIQHNKTLDAEAFGNTYYELILQNNLSKIWDGNWHGIDFYLLPINLSGILFGVTVIDTLKSADSFRRVPENYKVLAETSVAKGDYAYSLTCLEKIPQGEWTESIWSIYYMALLGLNDVDRVLEYLPRIHITNDETDFVDDHKYFQLISMAHVNNIAYSTYFKLFTYWIPKCQCEGLLFSNILAISMKKDLKKDTHLKEIFLNAEKPGQRLPFVEILINCLMEDWDPKDFIPALKKEMDTLKEGKFNKALLLSFYINFSIDNDFESASIPDRLHEFDTCASLVSKEKDLYFLSNQLSAILLLKRQEETLYSPAKIIFDKLLDKISNETYKTRLNALVRQS